MEKSLHSVEYKKLIDWLREQRELRGISMRELSEKLNVAHSFIGKVEQRERRLDVLEYVTYCNALEVDPIEGLEILLAQISN